MSFPAPFRWRMSCAVNSAIRLLTANCGPSSMNDLSSIISEVEKVDHDGIDEAMYQTRGRVFHQISKH